MSMALSLFLQCKGVIRSKHLDTQYHSKQHELQNKQLEKQEEQHFRLQYQKDVLYHNAIPDTRLGRFLLQNFILIHPNKRRAWLQLWYFKLYPPDFYPPTESRPNAQRIIQTYGTRAYT